MTGSLLKSPRLFSVFWPISNMLSFGWSPLVFLFPILSVHFRILWLLYREHQLQLVSLSLSCSVVFQFSSKVQVIISLFVFLKFYPVVCRDGKILQFSKFSLSDSFQCKIPKKFCVSHFLQRIPVYPTRHHLYGHLPPFTKTIQVRRTKHAEHCWGSRDKLISDVLLWTPT